MQVTETQEQVHRMHKCLIDYGMKWKLLYYLYTNPSPIYRIRCKERSVKADIGVYGQYHERSIHAIIDQIQVKTILRMQYFGS